MNLHGAGEIRWLIGLCALGLACSHLPLGDSPEPLRGRIHFEVYGGPACASPVGVCSRETYSGGIEGTGETVVQRFTPSDPSQVVFIQEDEVLHLDGGDLTSKISAAYDSSSPQLPVSSLHLITGGTGRYAGASGYVQLWGNTVDGSSDADYVAVILATPRPR